MSMLHFAQETLHACLASVAPVELLGMRLLREQPHLLGTPPAIERDQLVQAVSEIVAYNRRCAEAVGQLTNLSAVPLLAATVLEFGL